MMRSDYPCNFCQKLFSNRVKLKRHLQEDHLEEYLESIEKKLRGKIFGYFDTNLSNDHIFAFNEHLIAFKKMDAYSWNGRFNEAIEQYDSYLSNYFKAQPRELSENEISKFLISFKEKASQLFNNYFENRDNKPAHEFNRYEVIQRLSSISQKFLFH
jgi:succinate dehydrogenase flavin-adding protein (antitoxin of CptAB toxin-antitoxin module)